jgi:hypothetical protein
VGVTGWGAEQMSHVPSELGRVGLVHLGAGLIVVVTRVRGQVLWRGAGQGPT